MVPSIVRPPLEVVQSQVIFELLVVLLHPPTYLCPVDKLSQRRLLREIGEPVFRRLLVAVRPLDQQPTYRLPVHLISVVVRGLNPNCREAILQ